MLNVRMYPEVSFDVEVDDTAAANLCNLFGQYRLVLTNEHVTLLDTANNAVLSWLYRWFKWFSQRVSIASYAKRCISYDRFCLTVW